MMELHAQMLARCSGDPRSVEEIAAVVRLANEARFGIVPRDPDPD